MKCSHYLVHTFSPETVRKHSRPSRLLPLVYTPIDRQCIYWRKTFLQPLPEAVCTNISCAHEWEKFPDFPAIMQPRGRIRHPLFALYVKFLYLPAFRTSVFPMCSLLHRTHSAASPRPAMIPSPLFPALIPILAQVLVVAQALPDKKVLSTGPRPMFPSLSGTEPFARPAALYPRAPLPMLQLPSRKALREGTGSFDGMRCFPGKPCKWSHSLRALFAPGYSAMRAAFAGKTTLAHLVFGRDTGPGACHTFHK